MAVGGVHLSILKTVSQSFQDRKQVIKLFTSGMLLTFATSLVISLVTFLSRVPLGDFLNSQDVGIGVAFIAPGLMFFSLNKVMLALLNGLGRIKEYAIFQALRYLLFLIFIVCLATLSFSGSTLPVIFSLSEFLLFLFLFIRTYEFLSFEDILSYKEIYSSHLLFGFKAALGNLLLDVNTRVDVIVLGYFSSDQTVGIYSIAALIVEGFCQLPVVLRANVNPLLTQGFYYKTKEEFLNLLRKIRNLSYFIFLPIGFAIILIYPLAFLWVTDPNLIASWKPLAIIMTGVLVSVGYLPILTIFNQTGYPTIQTTLIFIVFITNLFLNIILVPLYGITGSAIATGLTFALHGLFIRWFVLRYIKLSI